MQNKTTVLGFDVSSKTIGWSVLQIDELGKISLIDSYYIIPPQEGDLIERIAKTRDKIKELIDKHKPDYIGIEQIVKFMKGKSSADSIIMLTSFNRMVSLVAYDYLGKSPSFFNVLSIRHGIKTNKILPAKEEIPDLVASHLGISFPYELSKRGKRIVENGDRADGIAVALYYAFILSGKVKQKKPVVKKIKAKKIAK